MWVIKRYRHRSTYFGRYIPYGNSSDVDGMEETL